MCKKRTPLLLGGLLGLLVASCSADAPTNCAEVSGLYYVDLELRATLPDLPDPDGCSQVPLESLDLSEDNRTVNTGTSAQNTRVYRFGCEVQVTYEITVTDPGDPDNMSGSILRNNSGLGSGTKYNVEKDAVLTGEAVFSRFDRDGTEICRALFDATWFPEDVWLDMLEDEQQ